MVSGGRHADEVNVVFGGCIQNRLHHIAVSKIANMWCRRPTCMSWSACWAAACASQKIFEGNSADRPRMGYKVGIHSSPWTSILIFANVGGTKKAAAIVRSSLGLRCLFAAYQRRTLTADALIASAYLSGTNTRRVRRALKTLFVHGSARTLSAGSGVR
jgi:hypothetical protein